MRVGVDLGRHEDGSWRDVQRARRRRREGRGDVRLRTTVAVGMVLASSVAVLGLRMRTSPSGTAPASEGDHGEAQLRRTGRAARPVPFTNATPATEFQGLGSSENVCGQDLFLDAR
jgi:hypothetical protein